MIGILTELGLCAANTHWNLRPAGQREDRDANLTWTWTDAAGHTRLLDYIAAPHGSIVAAGVVGNMIRKCDHRLVWATLRDQALPRRLGVAGACAGTRGWRPTDERAERMFIDRVLDATAGISPTVGSRLAQFEDNVIQVALTVPHTVAWQRTSAPPPFPKEARAADAAAREATDPAERRKFRRRARQLRCLWQAELARWRAAHSKFPPPPQKLRLTTGSQTDNTEEWAADLRRYCLQKYHDESVGTEVLQDILSELDFRVNESRRDGRGQPDWNWSTTVLVLARLPENRSPGPHPLCTEMLKALPHDVRRKLHMLFRQYYWSSATITSSSSSSTTNRVETPAHWRKIVLTLIPKTRCPRDWTEMRGISLTSVMAKAYTAGVIDLCRE